ncbi:MAG: biopolymer transporter ExbD [Thermoanaerobaculia bacterium]|nr:biopolymer transporter ExbD [Thermoanaerobaculia bacterium]
MSQTQRKSSFRTQRKVSDEIPTSSMADIAFLLVIYFMVTITLAATRGLDFGLDGDDDPADVITPVESVLVEIGRGGLLTVDRKAMALEDLLLYLEPKLERNPKKPVILRPQPESEYKHMVAVYDVLRQGREKLGLDRDIQVSLPTEREIRSFWQ